MKEIVTDARITDDGRRTINSILVMQLCQLPETKHNPLGMATAVHKGERVVVLASVAHLAKSIADGDIEPGLTDVPPIQQVAARLITAWMNATEDTFDLAVAQLAELTGEASFESREDHSDTENTECLGCMIQSFFNIFLHICVSVKETYKCT